MGETIWWAHQTLKPSDEFGQKARWAKTDLKIVQSVPKNIIAQWPRLSLKQTSMKQGSNELKKSIYKKSIQPWFFFCFSEAKNHYLSHSLICWAGQIGSGTSWDDENAWPAQCGEIISEIINRFEIFQIIICY